MKKSKTTLNQEVVTKEESYHQKQRQQSEVEAKLEQVQSEKKGTGNILNQTLSEEEDEILKKYYQVEQEKSDLERTLEKLKKEKNDVTEQLGEIEFSYKQENSLLNQKSRELKNLEIELNRADVKLDTLLSSLSENYGMTYEKAMTLRILLLSLLLTDFYPILHGFCFYTAGMLFAASVIRNADAEDISFVILQSLRIVFIPYLPQCCIGIVIPFQLHDHSRLIGVFFLWKKCHVGKAFARRQFADNRIVLPRAVIGQRDSIAQSIFVVILQVGRI